MSRVTFEKKLTVPRTAVWAALADFGNVHAIHPMIKHSHQTSSGECGLGATRVCEFSGGMGKVEEEITRWDEGRALSVAIRKGSMPVRDTEVRLALTDTADGGTAVRGEVTYTMKYGPLGLLMAPMMGMMMRRMLMELLANIDQRTHGPARAAA